VAIILATIWFEPETTGDQTLFLFFILNFILGRLIYFEFDRSKFDQLISLGQTIGCCNRDRWDERVKMPQEFIQSQKHEVEGSICLEFKSI
jgi:hypothetical protein